MSVGFIHAGPAELSRRPPRPAPAPLPARSPARMQGFLAPATGIMIMICPLTLALHEPVAWAAMALVFAALATAWVLAVGGPALAVPAPAVQPFLAAGAAMLAMPFLYHGLAGPGLARDTLPVAVAMGGAAAFLFTVVQAGHHGGGRIRPEHWLFLTALLFAAFDVIANEPGPPGHPGLSGPFPNRNGFALFLGYGILAGLHAGPFGQRPAPLTGLSRGLTGLVGWLAIGLLFLAAGLTLSRVGALSLVLALMVLAVLVPRPGRRAVGRAFAAAALFGTIAIAPLADRFGALARDMAIRRALFDQVIEMIRDQPLWGVGPGRFGQAYQQVMRPPVDTGRVWDHAHSGILNLWAEFGIIAGSVPLIGGLALIVWFAWRARASGDAAAATGAAALVLTAGHAATDFSVENPTNTVFLLTLVALALRGDRTPATPKEKSHV